MRLTPKTKTNAEIVRLLKKHRFEFVGKSRHGLQYHKKVKDKDYLVRVDNQPGRICPPGTLNNIIENSGLSREEFFNPKLVKKKSEI